MSTYKAIGLNCKTAIIANTAQELIKSVSRYHQLSGKGSFSVFGVEKIDGSRVVDKFNLEANDREVYRGYNDCRRYRKER